MKRTLLCIALSLFPTICFGQGQNFPGGSGSGSLPAGGTVGQALINTGPGAGTWQDPNISNTPMVLLNALSAQVTQTTASAVKIPLQSTSGTLVIGEAGITGAPVGCSVVLELQQSTGAPTSAAIFTQAFTPASGYQSFFVTPANGFNAGDNLIAVYNCATTFPTGGTLTVTFSPVQTTAQTGHAAISNGIWVDSTDVIWNQVTNSFSGSFASAFNCCSVTDYSVTTSFRILKPDGTIYDSGVAGTSWTYTQTVSGGSGSNGGCGTGEVFPVAGWLQGVFTYISSTNGGTVQLGQAFSNLYVLRNLPAGGNTSTCASTGITSSTSTGPLLLTGGPLTKFYPMSWVTGQPVGTINSQLPGGITHAVLSAPAAGANFTFTSPGQGWVNIQSIHFTLTTSNQTGNRTVCLFINNVATNGGTSILYYSCAAGIQPASTTMQYDFIVGSSAGSGGNGFQQTVPLPAGLILYGGTGEQISSQIQGIQTNDTLTNVTLNGMAVQVND